MPKSGLALLLVGLLGSVLGGCMQSTLSPTSNASFSPRDRQLLAHTPYAQASIPETYRRHIVDYTRKEQPGTILVDTNARLSVLRDAGRQGGPLRRDGWGGSAGLVRRRHDWQDG